MPRTRQKRMDTSGLITKLVHKRPNKVWTIAEIQHGLGTKSVINSALQKLCDKGVLARIGHGQYKAGKPPAENARFYENKPRMTIAEVKRNETGVISLGKTLSIGTTELSMTVKDISGKESVYSLPWHEVEDMLIEHGEKLKK